MTIEHLRPFPICAGHTVAEGNGLRAVECWRCGYVHLLPKPDEEELERLYRDEYYQAHNAGWFEKERREQWYWRRVYWARLRQFGQSDILAYIPRVLDWGAGCGWFVKTAQEWGSDATGYEPSSEATDYAFNELGVALFSVYPRSVLRDFVHLSLVLEHVHDPDALLAQIFNVLRPGGVLCAIVPNEFNPLQQELARRTGYTPLHPHHVNYLTPDSLERMVERAGFEVVRVTSTFPMEWLALHGLNYVRHPRLGRVAHWLRMVLEATALTVAPDWWEWVRDGWAARGWGREVELWARKPIGGDDD
jgi:SAM-dependent methyltransferase